METTNPVFVEMVRGPVTESRHRAAIAVSDASGRIIFSLLDHLGYASWVGAEYQPSSVTEHTLVWFEVHRGSQS